MWSNIWTVQPHAKAAAASKEASSLIPKESTVHGGGGGGGEEVEEEVEEEDSSRAPLRMLEEESSDGGSTPMWAIAGGRHATHPPSPLLPSRQRDDGGHDGASAGRWNNRSIQRLSD